jgi:hypothetical protein
MRNLLRLFIGHALVIGSADKLNYLLLESSLPEASGGYCGLFSLSGGEEQDAELTSISGWCCSYGS